MADIKSIKGIGDKTAECFRRLGILTTEDLILSFPRDYIHYEPPVPIAECRRNGIAAIQAVVCRSPQVTSRGNKSILTVQLQDGSGKIWCRFFHMPYLKSKLSLGSRYVFRGRYCLRPQGLTLEQPEMYTLGAYEEVEGSYLPVYGLTKGLTGNLFRKAVKSALLTEPLPEDYLPEEMRTEQALVDLPTALKNIHFPLTEEEKREARKRLVFDEFFLFSLAVRYQKNQNLADPNLYPVGESPSAEKLLSVLPYELTGAQKRTFEEIKKDLSGPSRMNRLVQGDVGSGKTILAFLALLSAVDAGYQAALMAPTEVLANQHRESLQSLLDQAGLNVRVRLLTGSTTAKEKREIYGEIQEGTAQILIGTHALIQEKVNFRKLGLVITDEQHRFGVRQRELFSQKGQEEEAVPHVLVMSATPIPRTLALILYADLNVSVVDELPANRKPIKNCVVKTDFRENSYRFIEKEIRAGHQAYLICPMVEESEESELENVTDTFQALKSRFPSEIRLGILHGKMKPKEKNEVMERFSRREIDLLISTTVVEVGVNVPNATVMMVENADHFGLAQLHQLRGRVGRGDAQAYCIFIDSADTEKVTERLQILNRSNDGFEIANEDLRLRGPGEFFGTAQSGEFAFELGDIYADAEVLKQAARLAGAVLDQDPELSLPENRFLKARLQDFGEKTMKRVNL